MFVCGTTLIGKYKNLFNGNASLAIVVVAVVVA